MCCIETPGVHSTSLAEGQRSGGELGPESRRVQFRAATLSPQEEENLQDAEYNQPNKHVQGDEPCRQVTFEFHVGTRPNSEQYVDSDVFKITQVYLYLLIYLSEKKLFFSLKVESV